MTNPFTEPLVPDEPEPQQEDGADASPVFETPARRLQQQRLQMPGYLLVAAAGTEIAVLVLSLLSAIFAESDSLMFNWTRRLWSNLAQTESSLLAILLITAASCIAAVCTFLGGVQMIAGGDLKMARLGAIATCLPLIGTLWGLAFPIGLWALRRLRQERAAEGRH